MLNRKSKLRVTGLFLLVLAALVLAACGGSSSSSSSGGSTEAAEEEAGGATEEATSEEGEAEGGGSEGIAHAQSEIERAMEPPPFKAPGPPFDASGAKGDVVYAIPASSAIPFVNQLEESMKEAGETEGVELVQVKNQGQPAEWNAGLQQAINANANAILLDQIDPELVKNEIAKAEAAGIPVISSHIWVTGEKKPPGVSAIVTVPFQEGGDLMADWTIWKTEGKGHALIVGEPLTPASGPLVEAMKEEFSKYCPECEVSFTQVPFTEWATKLQPAVQTSLTKDPSIEYVLPIYDSMTQFVNPAILASGRSSSVKVASADGTPFVVEGLEENNPPFLEMTVAENPARSGYAVMDQILRVLTENKPTTESAIAVQVLTKENVSEKFAGENFEEEFSKLWSGK
jgi:ribose transport system substrate-binding protein